LSSKLLNKILLQTHESKQTHF